MPEFTTNYGLTKPDFNQLIWHDEVNENFDLIDAILFAFTGLGNFVGAWTNSTNYVAGQVVYDESEGNFWRCAVTHTSAASDTFEADRTLNPTYWVTISTIPTIRGAWDNETVYNVGDVAYDSLEGLWGIANTNHTSSAGSMRDDILKWDIVFDYSVTVLADAVTFAPAGSIAATDVQAAIEELDAEKLAASLYTAADILSKLLTVDGAASGLDADLLDGESGAFYGLDLKIANNLSDVNSAAAAFGNIKQAASEAATGVAEYATLAEVKARTDNEKIVRPSGLADFARIKTGTYVGDGEISQAITGIGFTPKFVMTTRQRTTEGNTTVFMTIDTIVDDIVAGAAIAFGAETRIEDDRIISLDADGFTIDDNGSDQDPNAIGITYNYLAIG